MQQDETRSQPDTAADSPAAIATTALVNVAELHQGPKDRDIEAIETTCL